MSVDGEGQRWTVSTLLWATAYAGIGLASIAIPADREGVEGLLIGGAVVWSVAFLLDWSVRLRAGARPARKTALDSVVYLGATAVEAIASTAASREGQPDQALWFGLALGFALTAWACGRIREPGDGLLLTQLAFHGLMLIPAFALLINAGLSLVAAPGAIGAAAPLTRTLIVVASVPMPLVFVLNLTILALHTQRPASDRDRPAATLLVVQSACLVALLRWSHNGV